MNVNKLKTSLFNKFNICYIIGALYMYNSLLIENYFRN